MTAQLAVSTTHQRRISVTVRRPPPQNRYTGMIAKTAMMLAVPQKFNLFMTCSKKAGCNVPSSTLAERA